MNLGLSVGILSKIKKLVGKIFEILVVTKVSYTKNSRLLKRHRQDENSIFRAIITLKTYKW